MAYLSGLARGSQSAQRSALRVLAALLGYREPSEVPWEVTPDATQAHALRTQLRARYSGATCNRALSALRGVLRAAREHLSEDMEAALKGQEAVSARAVGRLFDAEEVGRLIAAARPTLEGARAAAIVATMWGSGLHREAICDLDVTDWSASQRALVVRVSKGRKPRQVQLHPAAVPMLARWLELRGSVAGPMFPALHRGQLTLRRLGVATISNTIEKLRAAAGVDPFTLCDLRGHRLDDKVPSPKVEGT